MIKLIFFGLGFVMGACVLAGYACVYVGAQCEPDEVRYDGMQ